MSSEINRQSTAAPSLLGSLEASLKPLRSVAVAFSGGVDSSVVLAAAIRALGTEAVIAVTADSETLPASELAEARRLAEKLGANHVIVETHELADPNFNGNPPERCYFCKQELWRKIASIALDRGIEQLADGVNVDDACDIRPGIDASDEAGVIHPLMEVGAGKSHVRQLARELGLPNWDKPAQACLSSRIPYGNRITAEGLRRVELAEAFLRQLGLAELRVRDHGDIARIEVGEESIARLAANGRRRQVIDHFKELGFTYVTLDLEGFRSGSMNETL